MRSIFLSLTQKSRTICFAEVHGGETFVAPPLHTLQSAFRRDLTSTVARHQHDDAFELQRQLGSLGGPAHSGTAELRQ